MPIAVASWFGDAFLANSSRLIRRYRPASGFGAEAGADQGCQRAPCIGWSTGYHGAGTRRHETDARRQVADQRADQQATSDQIPHYCAGYRSGHDHNGAVGRCRICLVRAIVIISTIKQIQNRTLLVGVRRRGGLGFVRPVSIRPVSTIGILRHCRRWEQAKGDRSPGVWSRRNREQQHRDRKRPAQIHDFPNLSQVLQTTSYGQHRLPIRSMPQPLPT
jgi:hypothetical protein